MVKKIKNDKIILSRALDLEKAYTLKNYEGKQVLGVKGEKLGRVVNVSVDDNHKIIALIVLKWFKKYYFDVAYIDSMTKSRIMLSITPITTFVGKQVFDAEGRLLGKVIEVKTPNYKNEFTDIVVRKNLISKKKIINKKEIKTNKKNIILNTIYA